MRRKLFSTVVATILLIAVLLGVAYWRRGPSIRPDDVALEAILRPPGYGENLLPDGRHLWTLEIGLQKRTDRSLWTDGWTFTVTPVLDGLSTAFWDHFQGRIDGTLDAAGGAGFLVLRDQRALISVARAMEVQGMATRLNQVWGFRYAGASYPARIRFYLDGANPGQLDHLAVAYTHQERWMGRDVGWTKLVKVNVVEEEVSSRQSDPPTELIGDDLGEIVARANLPGGELGPVRFDLGQALLSQPEPYRLHVTAAFRREDGTWMMGNRHTEVVVPAVGTFAAAALVNPVEDQEVKEPLFVLFGRVDDVYVSHVLVTPERGVPLRAEVSGHFWVAAVPGARPEAWVRVQYMTKEGEQKDWKPIRLPKIDRPGD
jgi:hypothetical protein